MKLASSRLLNGALGALLVSAVAAACGSDSQRKTARSAGGEAGGGGQAGQPVAQGGNSVKPEAGNGGEPLVEGGVGGAPPAVSAGPGCVPIVIGGTPAGGAGGVGGAGGAGGTIDQLPPVDCTLPLTFSDPQLEKAIFNALDTSGPLTENDLANLHTLNAQNYYVGSLEGLECFPR